MEFAFIDESGALYFLEEGEMVPSVGQVFQLEGALAEELPGTYLVEFMESYMYSDVLNPDEEDYENLSIDSEGLGFIGLAIREVSSLELLDIAKESMSVEMDIIKGSYEQISKILENYRFEQD